MAWRRLPCYLPNLQLKLMPLNEAQLQQVKETGWLREAVFRTSPKATKPEIKAYLQSVYGMPVEKVNTINYLGKKKRVAVKGKPLYFRATDWKKAYVLFKPPFAGAADPTRAESSAAVAATAAAAAAVKGASRVET